MNHVADILLRNAVTKRPCGLPGGGVDPQEVNDLFSGEISHAPFMKAIVSRVNPIL
jgi:hypothetical protein